MKWRVLVGWITFAAMCGVAPACLTDTLDAKTVQWSSLIVQAKLIAIGSPTPLATSAAATQPSGLGYQTYDLEVTDVVDGSAKVGDRIQIIRYLNLGGSDSSPCGQALGKDQIGKTLVVLARPQRDLQWSNDPSQTDPRPQEVKEIKAFAPISLQSATEMGLDALADMKGLVSDVRANEAQFSATDAQAQAATLAHAADETEAADARHALIQMGPKALPAIKMSMKDTNKAGQGRLQNVIDAITPPPLSTGILISR